jgi:predicted SprT family Zn-dependent metalloprotease
VYDTNLKEVATGMGKAKAKAKKVAVPTKDQYETFVAGFEFFNQRLFEGRLPYDVLITLQRRANSKGYFLSDRFQGREDAATSSHEIALNPDAFVGETDEQIASTLVHAMVHHWQHVDGKPGRDKYHNREWAEKMKAVGLFPSSTGAVGGKETGQSVAHYIIPGGRFEQAWSELADQSGFKLSWQSRPYDVGDGKRRQTRVKYTCPACGLNAWAKPGARLVCGNCSEGMAAAELEELAGAA